MTPRTPWWALASSVAAPAALIGGWTLAQAAQPATYDPVRQTISALARHGLDHRWIMTAGLAGLGVAHMATALGLRSLRPLSRVLLAGAGAGTVAVSVFAQPHTGSSAVHVGFATASFVALALLPAATTSRTPGTSPLQRPVPAVGVTVLSAGLLIWVGTGELIGLSERLLAAEQAIWPLLLVLTLRARRSGPDRLAR